VLNHDDHQWPVSSTIVYLMLHSAVVRQLSSQMIGRQALQAVGRGPSGTGRRLCTLVLSDVLSDCHPTNQATCPEKALNSFPNAQGVSTGSHLDWPNAESYMAQQRAPA
jgi:hypothetical protein